jgi:hypothetical protein
MSNLSIANCTVIGYTVIDERLKDELISNVSYQEIEIDSSSFSPEQIIKQFTRDNKIDSIFDSSCKNITHLLLNINNIIIIENNMLRSTYIRKVVSSINDYLRLNNNVYKLILTTSLYRNMTSNGNNHYLSGGGDLLYISDLAYMIVDGEIKMVKNRYEKCK